MWIKVIVFGILFFFGGSLGSFFTLVGSRSVLKKSIVKPSSHCSNCQKKLAWYQLVPVLSFVVSKGKCSNCEIDIPISYVIIECGSGAFVVFCLTVLHNQWWQLFFLSFFFFIIVIVSREIERLNKVNL